MSLIVAGLGAAASLAGTIIGKRQEARERRRISRFIDQRSNELDTWYRKESGTNFLDTAEGQSQYQGLRQMLRDHAGRVDDSLVKTGGTAEAGVAARQSAGRVIGDATRQMAAEGTRRRMNLSNIHRRGRDQLDSMRVQGMENRAAAWSTFAGNAANLASNWIGVGAETGESGWGDLFKGLKNRGGGV